MAILADCHLHSSHSGDSDTKMEKMVLAGLNKGLSTMCFTEHMDMDYPDAEGCPGGLFLLNTDSYLYDLACLMEKYAGKMQLLFGVELGLTPELAERNTTYAGAYDFDFIIGSSHVCHGMDPYYPTFFEGKSDKAAYREYFESILENINACSCFDVYGHLDYVVRYGKTKDNDYHFKDYADLYEAILKNLIAKGKGIELNTGGIKKGMKDFHPCTEVLKLYKELGGEIITIGSDSHNDTDIAHSFDRACETLKACGFKYYSVYKKRVPEFRVL